ncbi:c-type cytochrome [Acidicapsa acidisoli]|uniref:c-type cytochrome n=1 Tax=Acidicapsa acidisoli TaxID=1615681 RepID=UPI0021E0BAB1|nr:c-type cytochrome [Acidicapsa acidisoli]
MSRVQELRESVLLMFCEPVPPEHARLIMNWTKHTMLVDSKTERNPLIDNPAGVTDGKEAFLRYCIVCHGLDGQNTGVPFADRMSPPVPSLASKDVQTDTDGQLKWIIDYRIWPLGMPGSKNTLSDEEIWPIVLYLRHSPPAGNLGKPEIYTLTR